MAMILVPGASIFPEATPEFPTNYTYSVTAADFKTQNPLEEPYLSLLDQ